MSSEPHPTPAPATGAGRRSLLDQVVDQLAGAPACPGASDMIVVAVRPASDRRRVAASAGNSAIRAAISVAVAAGNLRPWATAVNAEIVDVPINTLPEIIRSTVDPNGIQSVRVGVLADDDQPACMTMWLSTSATISSEAERCHREILRRLESALEADRRRVAALPRPAAIDAPVAEQPADVTLPDQLALDQALEALESDETGMLILAIDGVDALDQRDATRAERLRQSCANRLVAAAGRGVLVARIAPDTYAVLLANTDRRRAFDASRLLRAELGTALAEVAADHLPIAVGFAHEDGLSDPAELFASAMSALRDSRQSGGSRMLVAC